MAASDAKPIPIRAAAYRVTFPILDADGDLVAGAAGLDSEFSEDAAAFADCTNEATEIATSSGMYYLDLANTEMDGDTVAVIIKSSSGKTTPIVMYPNEAGDIDVDVTAVSGSAVSTSSAQIGVNVVNAGGTAWASGSLTSGVFAAGAIAAGAIAADAIGASELAADAVAEIVDAVWDELKADHTVADSFGDYLDDEITSRAVAGDQMNLADGAITSAKFAANAIAAAAIAADAITAAKIADGAIDANTFAAGAITAAAIATGAIDADALAADAIDEIWDEAMTEIGAVPAVTDSLRDAIRWMFALSRNKITQTATTQTLRNDADNASIATAAVSDDATTATRGEWA